MSHLDNPVEEDWYERTFSALYPVLYAHRSIEAARREADFAADALRISKSDRVLDMACGSGRHMIHLQRYANQVVGLDFSRSLLRHAATSLGGNAALVRGDMRALPFFSAFDAVCNFFTSFGYFCDDRENESVVAQVERALKPNGRFLLDHINPDFTERTLVPRSTRSHGEYRIEEHRWIDAAAARVNKTTTVTSSGGLPQQFHESVRLYRPEALESLVDAAGFRVEAMYGDYDASAVSAEKPRMIIIAKKRAM